MCEICESNRDSSMSASAIKNHLRPCHSCGTSPFSSLRSWPNYLQCSLAFPPRWKPGRWGTFPDRERREDHSWWENTTHSALMLACLLYWSRTKLRMSLVWTYFFKASLRFLNLPSDETSFCSLSINAFVWWKMLVWIRVNREHMRKQIVDKTVVRTCLDTLSQVFLRRNTELRLSEEVISNTAL